MDNRDKVRRKAGTSLPDPDKTSIRQCIVNIGFEQISKPRTVQGCFQNNPVVIDNQRSLNGDFLHFARFFELPAIGSPARKAMANTCVLQKIARFDGSWTVIEISRCRDDSRTNMPGQPRCNHVRFEAFTETHACVEARRHDIGEAVFHPQVECNIGISSGEFAQTRCNDKLRRHIRRRDTQHPRRTIPRIDCGAQSRIDLLKRWCQPLQQLPPGLRRGNAARCARKKTYTQTVLQCCHCVADG